MLKVLLIICHRVKVCFTASCLIHSPVHPQFLYSCSVPVWNVTLWQHTCELPVSLWLHLTAQDVLYTAALRTLPPAVVAAPWFDALQIRPGQSAGSVQCVEYCGSTLSNQNPPLKGETATSPVLSVALFYNVSFRLNKTRCNTK